MKVKKPAAAQEAEYQRLVAIIDSTSTPFAEYKRAQQDLHKLLMQSLEY